MIFTAHADGRFDLVAHQVRCALGRNGVKPASEKREGDGASPAGVWPMRRALWRADRLARPATALPLASIAEADGWCDEPGDPSYNRPVRLPYPASAERLWRDEAVYDVIVVLGHNDDPPIAGMGSAIFLHVAKPDYAPTAGCIAVALPDLLQMLALAEPGDAVEIRV